MPALALRQISERSWRSRLKLRANCSANDVARFRSAICDKNDWLPKSPAHPTDPMLPLSFEGSCRSTLDVTGDRSAQRGRNPQAQLAGRPIDGGVKHLLAPLRTPCANAQGARCFPTPLQLAFVVRESNLERCPLHQFLAHRSLG